jgi:hypothetical protein
VKEGMRGQDGNPKRNSRSLYERDRGAFPQRTSTPSLTIDWEIQSNSPCRLFDKAGLAMVVKSLHAWSLVFYAINQNSYHEYIEQLS